MAIPRFAATVCLGLALASATELPAGAEGLASATVQDGTIAFSDPVSVQADLMDEIIRLDVGDGADRDTWPIVDARKFTAIRICAEKNPVRIRRAEVRLDNGSWQRLFVPLVLDPGKCSKAIDILRAPRKLRAVQFDYEALTAGYARGTLVVYAKPELEK
ncbi:MAG: hypothetical protein ACKVPY_06440 [Paracoccaceae bacterium]